MKCCIQIFSVLTLYINANSQRLARKANDGPTNPKPYTDNSKRDILILPNNSVQPLSQRGTNTFTFSVPQNNTSLTQLWNKLQIADQNLNSLLANPKNDVLYNQTKQLLLDALDMQSPLNLNNTNSAELKKIENFEFELNRKAIEVDRLRGLTANSTYSSYNGNKNLQVEQFTSGISEAFKQNETRNNELNNQISDLETKKSEAVEELKEKQKNVFQSLLQKEKEKEKQIEAPFNPKAGSGFSKILFDDDNLTLKYTLTLIERKICKYKNVPYTMIVEGKVVYHEELIPFAGYHYNANYEIINKKHQKLSIKGGISGSPGAFSKEHITPIGEIGECFGFNVNDTYWGKFYYTWDLVLTNETISATNHFWTEIADEEPSWDIVYSILN